MQQGAGCLLHFRALKAQWGHVALATRKAQGAMPAKSGSKIGDVSLPATGGMTFRLSEAFGEPAGRGKTIDKVVLYFYPKDNTPGCTTEGLNFRDLHADFKKAGAAIYGISRDSLKSHENFKAKM